MPWDEIKNISATKNYKPNWRLVYTRPWLLSNGMFGQMNMSLVTEDVIIDFLHVETEFFLVWKELTVLSFPYIIF